MKQLPKIPLITGSVLILAGLIIAASIVYFDNPRRITPLVYSNDAMLSELWYNYKTDNIEQSSKRTLDKSQNNITTSEGQSYTMLRAVWMDDKTVFDESWKFSKDNLQRDDDSLLSWKFGQRPDSSYGIMTEVGGQNTASDADVDTALSLLMAYSRWNDSAYLYQARDMIHDIWDKEVVMIQGKPVLTANDIERNSQDSVVVNPSYFSPYSFKIFSKVDPTHDWYGLADNSYTILDQLSKDKLGSAQSSGLPPNWIKINKQTGEYIANASSNLDTNYGYDALRIPFRLALDYKWFSDPRDKEIMQNFGMLKQEWDRSQSIKAVYGHDGTVKETYETPAMYGGAIGYFNVMEPDTAVDIYDKKLKTLYSTDRQQWKIALSYYDDNWAWFGIALTQDALPNLATINN